MEEITGQTPASTKKSGVAATIGLLLTALVAFGLGWAANHLYAASKEAEEQAAAAAKQAELMRERPVSVETIRVSTREMNPPDAFMGHVEPISSVDLRAQIDGTIDEVAFKEGAMVKEGDVLYRIDPRMYQARVAQAKAALEKAKATSANANRYYERMSKVDKRSVTETEIDQAYATMLECRAAIAQCEADLQTAEINLGYTVIKAPISGRIGASLLKKGDYVAPAMGSLARIVQVDPMRVVFSVPDREYLKGMARFATSGKSVAETIRAQLRLADGSIYEHEGMPDFVSNEMNAATASLAIRFAFANPNQKLLANAYVTMLLSEAHPQTAIAIPVAAVLANATGDYVYIVSDGRAARRNITMGEQQDGYVVILEGLAEGEEVITEGVVNVTDNSLLKIVNPAVTSAEEPSEDLPAGQVVAQD